MLLYMIHDVNLSGCVSNSQCTIPSLVLYAPTSVSFGPDCPDLEFVDVFWQVW